MSASRGETPWDVGQRVPFPAIRRLRFTTPDVLRSLPSALGARVGDRYLEAMVDLTFDRPSDGSPVALDPGGDLSEWQSLRWLDRKTGLPLSVSTAPADIDAVQLAPLADKAADWSRSPGPEPASRRRLHPSFPPEPGQRKTGEDIVSHGCSRKGPGSSATSCTGCRGPGGEPAHCAEWIKAHKLKAIRPG